MAYVKHTWQTGERIIAPNMNHIEDGIEDATQKADNAVLIDASQVISEEDQEVVRNNIGAAHVIVTGSKLIIL